MQEIRTGAASRSLAATGAVLAALAIGLSAYAAHGVDDGQARVNLQTASLYAFGHGVVLAMLAPRTPAGLARWALVGLLLGTLLFAGSVTGGALLGWPTRLAPTGGMLLMASWLTYAVAMLRR
ncbi:DUF423 domain-containing protein [Xanthomonas sp. XNM01]|uniref:DUF423 domain-containing protein n=1 Tax=Xanthomonas sp. XNM01 TaxID=2769289 RepID=UPI001782C1E1|nr:DUF423 domain-containing protein [Xanthomonas sp. XNM01]MBD9368660.1 DUF423 domain-containing protein [Xanthomonas sp. XNM01]